MSKNALVTVSVGEVYKEMSKLTHPSIKAYANRIGADFICIDESDSTSPHWEKFQIFNLLNKYDRIIYLDTDIIVRDDTPNLFDIVPKEQVGMFNEGSFTQQRQLSLIDTCKEYGVTLSSWDGAYYNTGVIVVSRMHKEIFRKPKKEFFSFYEQGYINMIIAQMKLEIRESPLMFSLPYKFNRMTCMDKFTGEERHASYIIHYAGYPSLEFVLSLIKQDINKWETAKPDYKFKRHILVDVQGGLGDQINAEPSIRFMKEHVYKDDDIVIKTHFPRVFKHIGLPVYTHEQFRGVPDTPYYHALSLPGADSIMWSVVSNLLCHTVDYCSMALLMRILPDIDKSITLNVDIDDYAELIDTIGIESVDDLVVVHPGRHWESKTFPVKWWSDVINGLRGIGLRVCVIGKNEVTRGVHDLELDDDVIDTRDRLSLGALFALLKHAKVLVSNDSAPVHIAGAFDNHIVLIPSCKHPDHVLPYRNGRKDYKSVALYKKLTLDDCGSAPTEVHGSSAEFISNNWDNYLPDVTEVVNSVVEVYKKEFIVENTKQ